jgi:hypothetical protein
MFVLNRITITDFQLLQSDIQLYLATELHFVPYCKEEARCTRATILINQLTGALYIADCALAPMM